MPHPKSRPEANAVSATSSDSDADSAAKVDPAVHASAANAESERSGPVFGIKAARGQAPYAILGPTGRTPAGRSASSSRTQPSSQDESETPPASAHSLRVSGGQVVETESDGGEARKGDRGKGLHEVRLPPIAEDLNLEDRPAEAMRLAQEAFSQTGYWVSFYRAILGVEGVAFKLFPTPEEMEYFEETAEFAEIHTMLTALRASDVEKIDAVEPQTMITIRMPRSLRAVLVEEAKTLEVSINKLCISKLLLPIHPQFVPPERGKVRGRKPGQQSRSNRAKKRQEAKSSKS